MPAAARRLILNCDDFGSCLAANEGVEQALTAGLATSATLMVPCPWAYDAALRARAHPTWAVGVHLTLTSEWPRYRWRPLLPRDRVPGLHDPDGFLWARTADVHAHASAEEALAESVAQIEQALAWGLRPTHLDSHMGVSQTEPAFYQAYLAAAARFSLPVRMAGADALARAVAGGQAWAATVRPAAAARGVRFPDDLLLEGSRSPDEDRRAYLLRRCRELGPGTSEMLFHPAVDSPELRAVTGGGQQRVEDLRLLTDPLLGAELAGLGILRVSYRDLG